jgi:hypothetical protein
MFAPSQIDFEVVGGGKLEIISLVEISMSFLATLWKS